MLSVQEAKPYHTRIDDREGRRACSLLQLLSWIAQILFFMTILAIITMAINARYYGIVQVDIFVIIHSQIESLLLPFA